MPVFCTNHTRGHRNRFPLLFWALLLLNFEMAIAFAQEPRLDPSLGFDSVRYHQVSRTNEKIAVYEASKALKPTVLLVHGLGENGVKDWTNVVGVLKKQYHVVGVDLPSFGQSTIGAADLGPEQFANHLAEIVRSFKKGPFLVVGHSMGAATSAWFTAQHPDLVSALVLVDAAGILHQSTLTRSWSDIEKESKKDAFSKLKNLAISQVNEWKDIFTATTDGLSKAFMNTGLWNGKNVGPEYQVALNLVSMNFTTAIDKIRVPTLIIWGEEDRVAPLKTGKVLRQLIARNQLITFKNVAHVPMKESPERFNRVLLEWLKDPSWEPFQPWQAALNEKPSEINCRDRNGYSYTGNYSLITLRNCENIVIKNAVVDRLVVHDSKVKVSNSLFRNSKGVAVEIHHSLAEIEASVIIGKTGIHGKDSRMDVIGSHIHGIEQAVSAKGAIRALFSLTKTSTSQSLKLPQKGYRWRHGHINIHDSTPLK